MCASSLSRERAAPKRAALRVLVDALAGQIAAAVGQLALLVVRRRRLALQRPVRQRDASLGDREAQAVQQVQRAEPGPPDAPNEEDQLCVFSRAVSAEHWNAEPGGGRARRTHLCHQDGDAQVEEPAAVLRELLLVGVARLPGRREGDERAGAGRA